MRREDPDALLALNMSSGWFSDYVARRRPAPPTERPATGHIPKHAWRFAEAAKREFAKARDNGLHIGPKILKATVRYFVRVTSGEDPILVALAAMREHPGAAGRQIAEDALAVWIRADQRRTARA